MGILIVFLGAGIGGAMRHGVNLAVLRLGWTAFPAGTLVINVLGSFLMGVLAEYFALRVHLPQQWRLFLTTGILGGFTTFSTFSMPRCTMSAASRSSPLPMSSARLSCRLPPCSRRSPSCALW